MCINKELVKIVKMLCFTLVVSVVTSISGCNIIPSDPSDNGGNKSDDISVTFKLDDKGEIHGKVKILVNDNDRGYLPRIFVIQSADKSKIDLALDDRLTFVAESNTGYHVVWPKALQPDNDPNVVKCTYYTGLEKKVIGIRFEADPPKPVDPVTEIIESMEFTKDKDVVYSTKGLGFGRKPNDTGLYYLIIENGKEKPFLDIDDAKSKIQNLVGLYNGKFAPFSSIHEGLEARWYAAKTTKYTKTQGDWLSIRSAYTDYVVSGEFTYPEYSYDTFNLSRPVFVCEDCRVFLCASESFSTHFADWQVVFVDKSDKNKGYSFHYGKYTLRNKYDSLPDGSKDPPYPKHAVFNNNKSVCQISLSDMLRESLEKDGVTDKNIEKVISKFDPLLPKNKGKYDIYLVINKYYRAEPEFETDSMYTSVPRSFRNVLKLNDWEFWSKCWKKKEN